MGAGENCQLFREQLSDRAEGDVDDIDVSALEGHLATCESCRAESVLLEGLVVFLRQVPEEHVPADFSRRLMARIDVEFLHGRFWRTLGEWLTWRPVVGLAVGLAVALLVVGTLTLPQATGPIGGGSQAAVWALKPIWWGGPLTINDRLWPPGESGRILVRPGDSLRTGPGVALQLAYSPGVAAEVRGRTSLILKNDGLFLTEGRVKVTIDVHGNVVADLFKVATAHATIVHVGTVFAVEATGYKTRTEVHQGAVRVFTSTGSSEELRAGQAGLVDTAGALAIEPLVTTPVGVRTPAATPESVTLIGQ